MLVRCSLESLSSLVAVFVIREAVKLQDVCIFQNAVHVLEIEASLRGVVSEEECIMGLVTVTLSLKACILASGLSKCPTSSSEISSLYFIDSCSSETL